MQKLIQDTVQHAESRSYISMDNDEIFAVFSREYGNGIGLVVCGQFDENDHFFTEYCYPYLTATEFASSEDLSVERHAATESYAGLCDEYRLGVTLIFYLQNVISYLKITHGGKEEIARGTSLSLSALAEKGTILLPTYKTPDELQKMHENIANRRRLTQEARQGNESAIEELTLEDMDIYTSITRQIRTDDVYSLVESTFMPYGAECDQYAILGTILSVREVLNQKSGEIVVVLTVNCNEIPLTVCVNKRDLEGEPAIGMRFKGNIWLQGRINFQE